MIKANITLSDLDHEPVWRDGAIHVGASRIVPYRHQALETILVRTQQQWFMIIRERTSSNTEGASEPDRPVSDDQFHQLYREALLWPLDYLMIEVARSGCRIKLHAGPLGIAPVYCRTVDNEMAISYDFADFLSRPSTVDLEIASRRLALHADYSARQICSGILMLTERSTLYAEPGRVHYRYPSSIAPSSPTLQVQGDNQAIFEELLNRAISARPAQRDRIAVELSGGMDSATVACALGSTYGPVTSLGILLDDDSGNTQAERRNQIVKQLGLRDEAIDIEAFSPILDLQPNSARKDYPLAEFYLEAFEELWGKAQRQGRELLFTGLGGDQLFPVYHNEPQPGGTHGGAIASEARRRAEGLMTPRARNAAQALNGLDAPPGPLPASVLASNVCQAPHLLRHGLWPINPLSDLNLSAYCRHLPLESRRNRETMWQFLHARLGASVFPRDYVKETFAHVLPRRIAEKAESIALQLHECALDDLGLVDRKAVLTLLNDLVATRARALTAPLIAFLWLERFVRQIA